MKRNPAITAVLLCTAAACCIIVLVHLFGKGLPASHITLATLAVASILFITEAAPVAVVALCVPIVLSLSGVLSTKEAFVGFANSNVVLFGGMFVIGGSMFQTRAADAIGAAVVRLSRSSEKALTLGVMIITVILSSMLSNTGTVAVLMPVVIGIADTAGWSRARLLMTLAICASLGGTITLVGTPPNVMVNAILVQQGASSFGFFDFASIGIPIAIAGCAYLLLFGRRLLPAAASSQARRDATEKKSEPGIRSKQFGSVAVLLGVVVVMITGAMPLHLAAMMGALICVCARLISEKEAVEAIDWTTICLLAGTLPLSEALDKSGAGKMIADFVISLSGRDAGAITLMSILFWITVVLTQFMSNTATCALLAPIGLMIARGVDADPRAVLMVIAVAASAAFATPIATPPNLLVTGPGGLKFKDFIKVGLPLIFVVYILCLLIVPVVWPF